jgi:peptidoglycan/LPS O-acetylase OafA/YrhL
MSATPYRPDIDGLRAVAVLAVVAYHAWPQALPGGFVGVDIFFVISGYLITRILLTPDFTFAGFYRRRVRRLAPALLLTIGTTLLVGAMILPPDGLRRMLGHAIGGTLFVANFVSYADAGYFGGDADLRPFLHLWSLGVEEQFYLVWPVAIWLALRHGAVTRLVVIGAAASFAAYVWLGEHDPRAAFFLPWSRFWELLAGALMLLNAIRVGTATAKTAPTASAHAGTGAVGAPVAGTEDGGRLLQGCLTVTGDAIRLASLGGMKVLASKRAMIRAPSGRGRAGANCQRLWRWRRRPCARFVGSRRRAGQKKPSRGKVAEHVSCRVQARRPICRVPSPEGSGAVDSSARIVGELSPACLVGTATGRGNSVASRTRALASAPPSIARRAARMRPTADVVPPMALKMESLCSGPASGARARAATGLSRTAVVGRPARRRSSAARRWR